IRTLLVTEERQFHFSASRGIVGAGPVSLSPMQVSLLPGDRLLMFSDGVNEAAHLPQELLLQKPTAQYLADEVLARWGDERDDASVLVYRHTQS
ncbi:SpoIIE family protein phosphatase, partial [Sphingomonas sp. 10B4]